MSVKFYFGTFQIQVTATDTVLDVNTLIPGQHQDNPYADAVLGFVETLLKRKHIRYEHAANSVGENRIGKEATTSKDFSFNKCDATDAYRAVCGAFMTAETAYAKQASYGNAYDSPEKKFRIFQECLDEALPRPKIIQHPRYEQKLRDAIQSVVHDYNQHLTQTQLNSEYIPTKLAELAISNPKCTMPDAYDRYDAIADALSDAGARGYTDQVEGMPKDIAEAICAVQHRHVEGVAREELEAFNKMSPAMLWPDRLGEIAGNIADHTVKYETIDQHYIAGLLHSFDRDKTCTKQIDSFLAKRIAEQLQTSMQSQRSRGQGK